MLTDRQQNTRHKVASLFGRELRAKRLQRRAEACPPRITVQLQLETIMAQHGSLRVLRNGSQFTETSAPAFDRAACWTNHLTWKAAGGGQRDPEIAIA